MISRGPTWGEHWQTGEEAVKKGINSSEQQARDRDPRQGGRLGRLAEEETGLRLGKCRPARRLRSAGRQGPFKLKLRDCLWNAVQPGPCDSGGG